mmetsp:Transcript_6422/g.12058  ORF Transcript_6422/g.12058 Transcript_6422/m.12058 type:complete len:209 (-) Transcript_6422:264-890(-)
MFSLQVPLELLHRVAQLLCPLVALFCQGLELALLRLEPRNLVGGALDLSLRVHLGLLLVHLGGCLLVALVALAPPALLFQHLAQLDELRSLLLRLLAKALRLGLQGLDLLAPALLLELPRPDVLHLVFQEHFPDVRNLPITVCGLKLREVPQQGHGVPGHISQLVLLRLELRLGDLRQHVVSDAIPTSPRCHCWPGSHCRRFHHRCRG